MADIINFAWLYQVNELVTPWLPESTPTFQIFLFQTLAAIVLFFFINFTLNKSSNLVTILQKKLYKSQLNKNIKVRLGHLLRNLNPNLPWLCGFILSFLYYSYIGRNNFFDIILLDFIFLYTLFRLTLLVSTYGIEHAYAATNEFASKPTLKLLYRNVKIFSYKTIIILSPLLFIEFYEKYILVSYLLFSLMLLLILRSTFPILENHKKSLKKFITKQLPADTNTQFDRPVDTLFFLYLLLAHCLTFIFIIHKKLLKITVYRQLTAKILWLHLDQKQQDTIDTEELIDENYEFWFKNSYQPKDIISTENITKLNEKIDSIIDIWLSERTSENNLLLRGNRGIGKSTLIKQWAKASASNNKVVLIDLTYRDLTPNTLIKRIGDGLGLNINSIEELVLLDEKLEKTTVVIDNCENLFLSKIGGFEPYKLILSMITMHLNNIFFIFVIGTETHKVLNNIFGQSNQFSHCLDMQPWKSEEIRELVMSRHKASKRKLVFDELLFSSMGNDEFSSYAATADRCFLLLAEKSNGNPSLAISSWYKTSSKNGAYTIEIGLPEKASVNFLNHCNADLLFIYASLIKHKWLTLDDASQSTRQSESVALRALKYGVDQGFLIQNQRSEFCIQPYWHFQIINFLNSKNYLTGI